jgi:hypothetical protein
VTKPKRPITKVPAHVKDYLSGKSGHPELGELVAHFFDIAGGPKAVASMLFQELHGAETTPFVRARIFDLLLWITKASGERQPPPPAMDLMSDADLLATYRELEKRLDDGAPEEEDVSESDGSGI